MTISEQIGELESRQLVLSNIMASSGGHAAKCAKLDLDFKTTYPADLAEYEAANVEYNSNESAIAELKVQITDEVAKIESEDPCL